MNIYMISIIALALGINYCLLAWLDYSILGLNGDIMSPARTIWGTLQTFFGLLLILFLLFKNKISHWHKYWTITVGIVFVMQLPIASLWYMMLMREPLLALSGVIIHTLLIVLITLDYLNSHKNFTHSHLHSEKFTEKRESEIKLDT